jgi:uncharacterized protein (TIGR03437 family)
MAKPSAQGLFHSANSGKQAEYPFHRAYTLVSSAQAMKHLVGILFCCALSLPAQFRIATVAGADHLREGAVATSAMFRNPRALAVDQQGNVYIADTEDSRIRRISTTGTITTVAGTGVPGFSGDGGKATLARINAPEGIAIDRNNVLYVADSGNNRVRAVDLASGLIRTVAGNGNPTWLQDGVRGDQVQFTPVAIAFNTDGDLYIADRQTPPPPARTYWQIRRLNTFGLVTSLGGPLTQFNPLTGMYGLAVDAQNTVYVAAGPDLLALRVNNIGFERIAGGGVDQQIVSVAVDRTGVIYYGDYKDARIVRVDPETQINQTIAGVGRPGFQGDGGRAFGSWISRALSMGFDSRGNLYFIDGGAIGDTRLTADTGNRRVRKIDTAGIISTIGGSTDAAGENRAHVIRLNSPRGLTIDKEGNLIIADSRNDAVRRLSLTNNTLTTIADSTTPPYLADPGGTGIFEPTAVATDTLGNILVGEGPNRHRIKRIVGNSLVTVAGITEGCCAEGIPATQAPLRFPNSIFVDPRGNIFVGDRGRSDILGFGALYRINTNLFINTITTAGRSDLPDLEKAIDPYDMVMDENGNLLVADGSFHKIIKVTLDGIVTTFAGTGVAGYTGDDGQRAINARLNNPTSIAYDSKGNLYIADAGNGVIRRIDQFGFITTVAGTRDGSGTYTELALATAVPISPVRLTVDRNDNVYFTDQLDSRVKMLFNTQNVPVSTSIIVQSGIPKLVAKVTTTSGLAIQGVPVEFAVVSGDGTLTVLKAITGVDGTASTEVRFGPTRDIVRVSVIVPGAQAVLTTITPGVLSSDAPVITSIFGAPQSDPPVEAVSTGATIIITGTNLASSPRGLTPADIALGTLPTNLGGTCVRINNNPAYLFSVAPARLSVQVPVVPPVGTTFVEVLTNCGTPDELSSGSREIASRAATPEMYYHFGNNVAAVNSQGELVGPPIVFFGSRFVPAKPGDTITIYGSGWGTPDPNVPPGTIPTVATGLVAPVRVILNGRALATPITAGLVAGTAGLYQATVRIPDDAPDGDLTITAEVFGVLTPSGILRVAR